MAYCTLAEVAAMDTIAGARDKYTDALITEAIGYATQFVDSETGTCWEPKSRTVTLDGNGRSVIDTGLMHVRSVTSCTEDGVPADVTGWVGTDTGLVRRPTGTFPVSTVGQNVVLVVSAGATATRPEDVGAAARSVARWYCLNALSRTPGNALQTVTDMGTVTHIQPGGPLGNPHSLPEVNRMLRRWDRDFRNGLGVA